MEVIFVENIYDRHNQICGYAVGKNICNKNQKKLGYMKGCAIYDKRQFHGLRKRQYCF